MLSYFAWKDYSFKVLLPAHKTLSDNFIYFINTQNNASISS